MVPGSQWFNSRIAAPAAAVSACVCAGVNSFFQSVGWNTKGWKCMVGKASCTAYFVGAHRAAPHDPILTAVRAATSPLELMGPDAV